MKGSIAASYVGLAIAVIVGWTTFASAETTEKSDKTQSNSGYKYHDGSADGKKSLGGSGEMIQFSLPKDGKIAGIKIHGSRYGLPQAPKEKFLIFVLDKGGNEVLSTQMAPYSAFERGSEEWSTIRFRKPIEVPKEFWLAIDFRAHQQKGVYVSYDTSTGGKHSRKGLPGVEPEEVEFGGDWMIELIPAK
jgi:RNA polymerase sigma-70 factor (ECF subfamily)